jgi:hypothetical protein
LIPKSKLNILVATIYNSNIKKNNYANVKILELAQLQKSQVQSYKAVFMTQNHAKRHFFGENCGKKSYAQICS